MSKTQRLVVIGVLVAAAALLAWRYAAEERRRPSTRDAYVGADVVDIAAQVSGPIVNLPIRDNQHVSAGDLLFEIDPAPFQLDVENASANVALTDQSVRAQADVVSEAQANIAGAEAAHRLALSDRDRIAPLAADGAVPQEQLDQADAQAQETLASLEATRAAYAQARDQLGALGADNPEVRAAVAAYDQALLNLSYTRVTAPAGGWITNLQLREGTYVAAGNPVITLVEDDTWHVWAYMREDVIDRIRVGHPVTFELPAYPDRQFKGRVEGIAWGIMQENLAGAGEIPDVSQTVDWVRLAQRFPVRVRVLDPDPAYPLRIGMTATAWIDTTVPPEDGDGS
jgi:membrane fusion protein (multidrug efflux system)